MELPVISARTRDGVSADVAELLRQAETEITALNPKCDASGRCCRFEEYGHRLYVTTAELIHFAAIMTAEAGVEAADQTSSASGTHKQISLPQYFAEAQPLGCPYQVERLCHARAARPLGCRIYFCDPSAQSWQNTLYERYHQQLKATHLRWDVEYAYIEWRSALSLALSAGWLPNRPKKVRTN